MSRDRKSFTPLYYILCKGEKRKSLVLHIKPPRTTRYTDNTDNCSKAFGYNQNFPHLLKGRLTGITISTPKARWSITEKDFKQKCNLVLNIPYFECQISSVCKSLISNHIFIDPAIPKTWSLSPNKPEFLPLRENCATAEWVLIAV